MFVHYPAPYTVSEHLMWIWPTPNIAEIWILSTHVEMCGCSRWGLQVKNTSLMWSFGNPVSGQCMENCCHLVMVPLLLLKSFPDQNDTHLSYKWPHEMAVQITTWLVRFWRENWGRRRQGGWPSLNRQQCVQYWKETLQVRLWL